jgi:general secretion pathway protein J
LTFAQMESDCGNVVTAAAIGNRPQLIADGERLRLVRTVFADDQPSRLEVVVYRLKDGVLSRRESIATRDLKQLDALWSSTADDTDGTQPVVLQSGVTSMAMRLWLGNGPWQTIAAATPDPSASTPAPAKILNPTALRGLEVTLQTKTSTAPLLKVFLLGPA